MMSKSECNARLVQFNQEFFRIVKDETAQESESQKLNQINQVLSQLKDSQLGPSAQSSPATYSPTLLKFGYSVCLIFGGLANAAGSYLFSYNLFLILPGISQLALYSLISVYILLDAILFYAFDVSFLKKAFGFIAEDNADSLLNKTYLQQLTAVEEINLILNDKNTAEWQEKDPESYQSYCAAMQMFNEHLITKSRSMKEYSSSIIQRVIENCVGFFGAFSCVADSYFMAKTALVTLHISFLSSPVGFLLIIGMVVASLALYYTMRTESLSELLNPQRKSHNELRDGLLKFEKYLNRKSPFVLFQRRVEIQNEDLSLESDASYPLG